MRHFPEAVRGTPEHAAAALDVARTTVREWAQSGLRSVCPPSAILLEMDGRFDAEVATQVGAGRRPMSLHLWGRMFLRRLPADRDSLVRDIAGLELSAAGDAAQLDAFLQPWIWTRDPHQVVLALLAGTDPRIVPELAVPVEMLASAQPGAAPGMPAGLLLTPVPARSVRS